MATTAVAQRSGDVSDGCVWSWPQWSTTRTAPHGGQTTATRTRAEERETYSAPRRQEPPLPAVTTGTQYFTLDDESVSVTGCGRLAWSIRGGHRSGFRGTPWSSLANSLPWCRSSLVLCRRRVISCRTSCLSSTCSCLIRAGYRSAQDPAR